MSSTLSHRRFPRPIAFLIAAAVAAGLFAVPATAGAKPSNVKVMTRNLYLGADLTPIIAAPTAPAAYTAAGTVYEQMVDTNFPARSRLLADEIAEQKPDLIGLQEVSLWRRGQIGAPDGPAPGGLPAEEVVYDFLESLTDQMARRGLDYEVAVMQQEADLELPVDRSGNGVPEFDARLTMFDVILAKSRLKLSNATSTNYSSNLTIPTAGAGNVTVLRGYGAVDVKKGKKGKSFRFIDTHLEAFNAFIRKNQATELVGNGGITTTAKPVVIVGDMNSDPDDDSIDPQGVPTANSAAYDTFLTAGFTDQGVTEPTFGFSAPLRDPDLTGFDTRIDHVFSKGAVTKTSAVTVGKDTTKRTPTGLWPSDHAGVVAKLKVG